MKPERRLVDIIVGTTIVKTEKSKIETFIQDLEEIKRIRPSVIVTTIIISIFVFMLFKVSEVM